MAKANCSIPECEDSHNARGLCGKHYRQFVRSGRTLPPLVGHKTGNLKTEPWLRDHIAYSDSACLVWPFGSDSHGYGTATLESVNMHAHRAMCILAHGRPPAGKNEAAHSCGNRLCVNPAHVYWSTVKRNMEDKYRHGTALLGERVHLARVNQEQVLAIMADGRPSYQIAEDYPISARGVRHIKEGRTWCWLTGVYHPSKRSMKPMHDTLSAAISNPASLSF